MEIKKSGLPGVQLPTAGRVGGGVSTSNIPEVSDAALASCLRRSKKAVEVHETILKRVDSGVQLSQGDLEGMLARAGVEKTDVKTVIAYHAKHHGKCFDDGALTFLNSLDWKDVGQAHVEELKRQNKEQVASHQDFIKTDKREFEQLKSDDTKGLQKKNDEKSKLQKQSAFERDADFADEITKSGISDPKQATLLALQRKRFTNNS